MNRVIAVTATLATAAAVAGTMAATVVPAAAVPRPAAAHPAPSASPGHANPGHSGPGQSGTAAPAKPATAPGKVFPPTVIGSELDGGKYVTVVHCQGVDSPPPITLAKPATPLIVNGAGPSTAILKMLQKPNPYTTVYTCTVTVKEKKPAKPKVAAPRRGAVRTAPKQGCVIMASGRANGRSRCPKDVTLNTGFGGRATQVKNHHPAG
jgi:hypothetical protein